ncbi:MAG: ABC transporter permease [Firmicutes bacterium]|nr:ABC transporter permease [Bacillota bacterium]
MLGIWATPLEQGLAYGILVLGVYLTFRILNYADLTVDGSFPLGAAIAATAITKGIHPAYATMLGFFGGALAGTVTGFLNTKLKISSLLAGILTMTGLYSVNLRIMGGRSNIPLLREATLVTMAQDKIGFEWGAICLFGFIVVIIKLVLDYFLHTEIGLGLRACGDNEKMIKALGVDTDLYKIFGLAVANGLVAMAGSIVAQYQAFADVGMGIGTAVAGLASVILGEAIIRPKTIWTATLSAVLGSILYRFTITFALRAGFAATDLRLVTAVLVIFALALPRIKEMKLVKKIAEAKKLLRVKL